MQIVKNHKYWLCLEPYVFVFGGKDNYMLYNGFAHKYIIINNIKENKDIISVLDKMMDMGNMYCVCLSSQKLATEKFSTFINDIRNGFYGDIYDEKIFETRPAIFPPIVNVKNSYVNINKEEELLHELTTYINGQCKNNCKNCSDYGKLVITPNKQVYANLNFPSIGIFEDDFMKFTKLLLTDDSPWFRTRKKIKPCNDCAFRYLCASPSNYEIALNRNNLCTIIK